MATGRNGTGRAKCEDCFFHRNLLCAVSETGPCATYRPDHPEGLRPPSQLRFVFRQERRLQVAWAFPSANEQVALHAQAGGVPVALRELVACWRDMFPGMYWPLIGGLIAFVLFCVLMGWIMDVPGRDSERH